MPLDKKNDDPAPNIKKAGTSAGDRILARLQKKVESEAVSASLSTPTITSVPNDTQEIHEIILTDELAQTHQALQEKLLSEQQVIELFLRKFQLEKDGEKFSLMEIARNERFLSKENAEKILTIQESKKKFVGKLPKPSQFDFALAHRLVDYKLMDRKNIQIFLRILSNIYSLGLQTTLQNLLVASKTLASDILKPIVDQFQKEIQEKSAENVSKIEISSQAIRSKTTHIYPIHLWVFSILILIIVSFLYLTYPTSSLPKPQISSTEVPSEKRVIRPPILSPNSTPVETIPLPPQHIPPVFTPPDPKDIEKEMASRGLSQWGQYWIEKEHFQILSSKYPVGTRPRQISWEIASLEVIVSNYPTPQFNIQGKLELPELPEKIGLVATAELGYGLDQTPLAQQTFSILPNRPFQISWQNDTELPLGSYWIKFSIFPENQSEFLRYFLTIESVKTWENWFSLGTPEEIAQYYANYRILWQNLSETLWKEYQKITPKLPKSQIPAVQSNVQNYIAKIQKSLPPPNIIHPLIRLQADWQEIFNGLNKILEVWENWRIGFDPIPPDTWEMQMEWEVKYEEFRANLYIQEQRLQELLRKPNMRYAQRQ